MKDPFFASQGKRAVYKKVSAALLMLSLNLSLGGVGATLLGSQVAHAGTAPHVDTYSITGTATVLGTVATANGSATVDASGANAQTIHIGIDWNEDGGSTLATTSIVELASTLVHTSCVGSNPCSVTWGPAAHDYVNVGPGTYKAFAVVYHGNVTGNDGIGSSQIAQITIVIPPSPTISANISSPGTTGPSGSITYTVTGATAISCTLALGAGTPVATSCTLAGPYLFNGLTSGVYAFALHATGPAGVADASVSWTVDATGPTVSITSGPTDESKVNTTSATFGFGSLEPGATFQCSLDGADYAPCSSTMTYSSLSQGSHTFSVRGVDTLGNTGASISRSWTVDTTAPVIATPADVTEEATSVSGVVVFYTSPATSDAVDGAGIATCSPLPGSLFAFGDTTVNCTASDAAGNVAALKSFVVHVVDTTAPVISVSAPTGLVKTVSATFSATDLFSIVSVECKVSGGDFGSCTSPFAPSLTDGTYTITVRAVDIHNNTGVGATGNFTIDLTLPAVSITAHPDLLTKSTAAHFAFTGETAAALTCALDTLTFTSCTSPMDYTVGEGAHTFTVHATDEAGNIGTDSFTWTVDTTAPTVSIIAPTVTETTGPTGSVTYTVGDGTVVCTLDGQPVDCSNTAASFTGLSDGDHTFTVTSTDAAGNSTSQSVTWHVDATGPVVTITSGPDEGSTVNTTSATLGFTSEEGATFECQLDGAAFASCASTKPYDALTDGSHIFKVHATDTYGNVGSDVSRTWTVNTTPASPTCETNQTLVDGHCVTNETPQPPTGGGGNGGGGSGGGSSSYDYWGCTNSSATNFNALANKDDGSCQLPSTNGGGTATPPAAPAGEVLGASTTTGDLPLPKGCSAYVTTYMKKGKKNNTDEVKLLQSFLNEEMDAGLPVTGYFGNLTRNWVKKFQVKHKKDILQPWIDAGFGGMDFGNGTGYVYKTTKRAINMMKCSAINEPMPVLTPDTGN